MAKGIYERKGKNGDVTFYIRYQVDLTDIKERVGRKSRGFTREMAKDALKARLGEIAQGRFNLEKARKSVPFSRLWRASHDLPGYRCRWRPCRIRFFPLRGLGADQIPSSSDHSMSIRACLSPLVTFSPPLASPEPSP